MALILIYYFEDFLEEIEEVFEEDIKDNSQVEYENDTEEKAEDILKNELDEISEESFEEVTDELEFFYFSQPQLNWLPKVFLYRYFRVSNKKTNFTIKKTNTRIFHLLKAKTYLNSQNSLTHFFFLYYQLYFTQLLKFPIVFKLLNTRDIVSRDLIYFGVHASKVIKWKQYNIIYDKEIVENLLFALSIRNLKLFISWIQKYFEKAIIKRHRKLFILFSTLLGKFIWKFNIFLQLKGLRLSLRGKFGKAGSVRKVRKYVRRGRCSYSSKNLALESKSTIIRTLTGVYSITFEIFF